MVEIIPTRADVMAVARMLAPEVKLTEDDVLKVHAQMLAVDVTGIGKHEAAYQRALIVHNFKKNLA